MVTDGPDRLTSTARLRGKPYRHDDELVVARLFLKQLPVCDQECMLNFATRLVSMKARCVGDIRPKSRDGGIISIIRDIVSKWTASSPTLRYGSCGASSISSSHRAILSASLASSDAWKISRSRTSRLASTDDDLACNSLNALCFVSSSSIGSSGGGQCGGRCWRSS
jgi:hypothetical protein